MTPELESLYARLTELCDAEERGERRGLLWGFLMGVGVTVGVGMIWF